MKKQPNPQIFNERKQKHYEIFTPYTYWKPVEAATMKEALDKAWDELEIEDSLRKRYGRSSYSQ